MFALLYYQMDFLPGTWYESHCANSSKPGLTHFMGEQQSENAIKVENV